MTAPVETSLAVVPANSLTSVGVAFVDRSGGAGTSLAPLHAPIDTTGTRIDPATSELQTQILSALAALAAFSTATAMTSGTSYSAARAVGVVCTAPGGNIVLTLSGGGTITLPLEAGWQTFPFAATAYSFSGGALGSVYNLT